MTLLSELNSNQHALVKAHIQKCLQLSDQLVQRPIPDPCRRGSDGVCRKKVGSFWLKCDHEASRVTEDYIITESVQKNLENLARAISARQEFCRVANIINQFFYATIKMQELYYIFLHSLWHHFFVCTGATLSCCRAPLQPARPAPSST